MRRLPCKAPIRSPDPRLAGADHRAPGLRPVAGVAMALACALLPSCSGPILTFRSQGPAEPAATLPGDPVSTGSIAKAPVTFGRDLGDEDWRRAHAALAVALDPQGNGRPVKWDNPETAMRGQINPTGLPYVSRDEVCRDFLASVISGEASRFVRGTGCKPSGGEWTLQAMHKAAPPARESGKGPDKAGE